MSAVRSSVDIACLLLNANVADQPTGRVMDPRAGPPATGNEPDVRLEIAAVVPVLVEVVVRPGDP